MKQKIYQVDAFTNNVFSGNPAAVCPLGKWMGDDIMQKIAMENNLAETAFYVKSENQYEIRWFTPAVEVDLCGHATLATAYVLFNCEGHEGDIINFYSPRSGGLSVSREEGLLALDFPVDIFETVELSDELTCGFNIKPHQAFKGKTDFLLIFNTEDEIKELKPNLELVSKLNARGVIVSARGKDVDFVSRFFAPQSGINEDPVTGSAHTTLTSYWSEILNKQKLTAIQLSERTGYLICRNCGERIKISGECKLYMSGEIYI